MTRDVATTLLGLLLFVLPAGAQRNGANATGSTNVAGSAEASAANNSAPKTATVDPNYIIGPQDNLDISVWKEPEVSRAVPVRPDGKISLPLLNDVQAAGLTPSQLQVAIARSLGKFMTNPEVTVIVTQINSQRIYVLGEVTRAGGYTLLPGMTVLQAISNAGGLTQFANGKKIYVLRPDGAKQDKIYFNYKDVLDGKRSEENVALKPGDTIVVP